MNGGITYRDLEHWKEAAAFLEWARKNAPEIVSRWNSERQADSPSSQAGAGNHQGGELTARSVEDDRAGAGSEVRP